MMVPAKGAYMAKDLERQRDYWGIPLHGPSVRNNSNINMQRLNYLLKDPFDAMITRGTLLPQRFLTAISEDAPDYLEPAARELWMRIWSRDEPIDTVDNLKEARTFDICNLKSINS